MKEKGRVDKAAGRFVCEALFTTITSTAWHDDVIKDFSAAVELARKCAPPQ